MDSEEDLLGDIQGKEDYQELDDLDADEEIALLGDSDEESGTRAQINAEQYEYVDEDGNPVEIGENEDVEYIEVAQEGNSENQFEETGADDILDLVVDPDLEFDDSATAYESVDQAETDVSTKDDSRQPRQTTDSQQQQQTLQPTQRQVQLKRRTSLTRKAPVQSQFSKQPNFEDTPAPKQPQRTVTINVQQPLRSDSRETEQDQSVTRTRDSDESEDEEEAGRGRFRTERTNIIQLSNRRPRTNLPDSLDAVFAYDDSDRGNRGGGGRNDRRYGGGRDRGRGNRDRASRGGGGRYDRRDREQGGREGNVEGDRRKDRDQNDSFKMPALSNHPSDSGRRDEFAQPPASQSQQFGGNRNNAIPSLLDKNFEHPGLVRNVQRISEPQGIRKILINPHFKGPIPSEGSDEGSPYSHPSGGYDTSAHHTSGHQSVPQHGHGSQSFGQTVQQPPVMQSTYGSQSDYPPTDYQHGQQLHMSQPPPAVVPQHHHHQQHHPQQQQQQHPLHNAPMSANFGSAPPQMPSFPPPNRARPPPPTSQEPHPTSSWPPPNSYYGGNKVAPPDLHLPPPSIPQYQDAQQANSWNKPPPRPNFNQLNSGARHFTAPVVPLLTTNRGGWDPRMPSVTTRPPPLFSNQQDLHQHNFSNIQQMAPPPGILGAEPVQRLVQFNSPPPNFASPPPVRAQHPGQWAAQVNQSSLMGNYPPPASAYNQPPPIPVLVNQSVPSVSGISPLTRIERAPENNFRQQAAHVGNMQNNSNQNQWMKSGGQGFPNSHQQPIVTKRFADKQMFNTPPKQIKMAHIPPKQANWRSSPQINSNIKEIVLVDTLPTPNQSVKNRLTMPTSRQASQPTPPQQQSVDKFEEEDEETRRYRQQIELQKKKREQIIREKELRRQMMAEQRRKGLQQPETNELTPKPDTQQGVQIQRPFDHLSPVNPPNWNANQQPNNSNRDSNFGNLPDSGFAQGNQRRKIFVRKVLPTNLPQGRSFVEMPPGPSPRIQEQHAMQHQGGGNRLQRQQPIENAGINRLPVKRMALQNIEVCVQKTPSNNQPNRMEPFQQHQLQQQPHPRSGGGMFQQRSVPPHLQHLQQHQSPPGPFTMSTQYRPAGPDHQAPTGGMPSPIHPPMSGGAPSTRGGRIVRRAGGPRTVNVGGQFQRGRSGAPINVLVEPQQHQSRGGGHSPSGPPPGFHRSPAGNNQRQQQRNNEPFPFRTQMQQAREFGSVAGPNRVVLMPQDPHHQPGRPGLPAAVRLPILGESPTAGRPPPPPIPQRVVSVASGGPAIKRNAPSQASINNQKMVIANRQSLAVAQTAAVNKSSGAANQGAQSDGSQRKVIVHLQPPSARKVLPPLIEPSSVRIENLAVATSDDQIRKICESVGAVESIIKDKRTAVVKFKDQVHAKQFMNRYQRRMVDLSLIAISMAS